MTRRAGPKRPIPEDAQISSGERVRTNGDLCSSRKRGWGPEVARDAGNSRAGTTTADASSFGLASDSSETETVADPEADRQHGIPASDPDPPDGPPVSEAGLMWLWAVV